MVTTIVLACLILAALVAVIVTCNRSLCILRHVEQFVQDCEEAAEEEADRILEKEKDCDEWLCACGHYQEDAFHCDCCGAEPPWGCPCETCQSPDEDDEEFWAPDYEGEAIP